jgi:hypothetical protein
MRIFKMLVASIAVISFNVSCKTSNNKYRSELQSENGSNPMPLRGITQVSLKQVLSHAQFLTPNLPTKYEILFQQTASHETEISDCKNLQTASKTLQDPSGVQRKFADLLGFEDCEAKPEVKKGILTSTCKIGLICSGPKVIDGRKVYIDLVLSVDYQKGASQDSGGMDDCAVDIYHLSKIDDKSIEWGAPSSYAAYVPFKGVTKSGKPTSGCRFLPFLM